MHNKGIELLRFLRDALRSKIRDTLGTMSLKVFENNAISSTIVKQRKSKKHIFALDLHTSVTRAVSSSLENSGFCVRRWSICSSSYLYKEPNLKLKFINSKSWKELNPLAIRSFKEYYKYFLDQIDSFLVSYSFSLLRVFEDCGKPILAINATRYESPYTLDESKFLDLNNLISNLNKSNFLTVISNNEGDKDYLEYFTGVKSQHIPSLCEYVPEMKASNGKWVVMSRNPDFARYVASFAQNMHSQFDLYPNGFSHSEFARNKGVVYIPYNISTMRLFELTTAGFPIRIPTNRLMMEWIRIPGVLDELSWIQVSGSSCPTWLKNTPADPEWINFYDWWLLRADWHNSKYFPNVKLFDSLEELEIEPKFEFDMTSRNREIKEAWLEVTDRFYDRTRNTLI